MTCKTLLQFLMSNCLIEFVEHQHVLMNIVTGVNVREASIVGMFMFTVCITYNGHGFEFCRYELCVVPINDMVVCQIIIIIYLGHLWIKRREI